MGLQVTRLKNVCFENTHTQHDTVSVSIKIFFYLVLQLFPLHVMPLHRVTIKILYLVSQLSSLQVMPLHWVRMVVLSLELLHVNFGTSFASTIPFETLNRNRAVE